MNGQIEISLELARDLGLVEPSPDVLQYAYWIPAFDGPRPTNEQLKQELEKYYQRVCSDQNLLLVTVSTSALDRALTRKRKELQR